MKVFSEEKLIWLKMINNMIFKEYNSSSFFYDSEAGIYTLKDNCEALFNFLHPEYRVNNKSVDIEYDAITMKTKISCKTKFYSHKF